MTSASRVADHRRISICSTRDAGRTRPHGSSRRVGRQSNAAATLRQAVVAEGPGRASLSTVLPDILGPDLNVVFVGTSVATTSVARGRYYSGPGNQFWSLLKASGLIGDRRLGPDDDQTLPNYGIGLTDLVKRRASSSDSNLTRSDFDVSGLVARIAHAAPRFVAFNGLTSGGVAGRALRHGKPSLGLAAWKIGTSAVFVLPSSSAAACDPSIWAPHQTKADWWRELACVISEGRPG